MRCVAHAQMLADGARNRRMPVSGIHADERAMHSAEIEMLRVRSAPVRGHRVWTNAAKITVLSHTCGA